MQILHALLRTVGLLSATVLIVIGYGVAPVLFVNVEQVAAGNVVGQLLSYVNIGLLVVVTVLLVGHFLQIVNFVHNWLLVISGLIVLLTEYWISPLMQAIKAVYPEGLTKSSPAWSEFAMWHGIYQLLFLSLIVSLILWSLFNLNQLIYQEKKVNKKSL